MTATLIHARPIPRVERPHPALAAIIRRLAITLLVACVIPAVVFTTTMLVINIRAALVAALLWSYGAVCWQMATRRRKSGLLILTVALVTVRTSVALASGSTFLYFLQPIATDALLATVFFGSLATARPVVSRLAGDFYPMDAELAQRPRIRRLCWRLTFMWAALCLTKAVMTYWLLQSQSVEAFVVIKSASVLSINAAAVAATVCAAVVVARKEGLLGSPLTAA
ncbi:MAG: VC0807 family protein [Nocardioidaceae bacterium]